MNKKLLAIGYLSIISGFLCANDVTPATKILPKDKEKIIISSLPDNVKLIIGQDKVKYYTPRVKAIHKLPDNMPKDQIDACYDFLYIKLDSQQLPDLQFNGLKNELVFALIKQRNKPAELSSHLVKMYKDKSFDTTWRDYCVQFFGKWYPFAPRNEGRQDMAECLWDALKNERTSRIAGAAASQLVFLTRKFPEFDKERVASECYEALIDPKCADISKVALLQSCSMLKYNKVLPTARKIAEMKSNPILRASAIAVIGNLGSNEDLPFLQQLESSSDLRLQRPAKAAIEKIKARK